MKKLFVTIIVFLSALGLQSQEIEGTWNGLLKIQGTQLRLVFHIDKTETGYSATMDSPDQSAKGIPATVSFRNPNLTIEVVVAGIKYTGNLQNEIKTVARLTSL